MKQYEVLQWAFSFLKEHKREEKIAELLLKHYTNVSRATFYRNMQEDISDTIIHRFKEDVKKHAKTGIPVQHLLGYSMFYGRKFAVNQNVLIPRFETEELVQHVIEQYYYYYDNEPITIIDVGTGSGVIAITLALELKNVTVYATDISENALQVAKKNAKYHQAPVHFLQGHFLEPIIDQHIQPQMIVSNPPYINEEDRDQLADTVKDFDPSIALFAKNRGLSAYEMIFAQMMHMDLHRCTICLEIGFDQAEDVISIIKRHFIQSKVQTIKDINNKDRIISVILTS